MKLLHPYVIKITGDPEAFVLSARDRRQVWYLLERLFCGEEVSVDELESWGLKIELVDEFITVKRESME